MASSLYTPPLDELIDPKEFAHQTGLVLRGVSLMSKPDGWQIVVRAWSAKQGGQYAMASAQSDLVEGLRVLLTFLYSKRGGDLWRKDKFA
jgi:hypothetical protein